MSSVIGVADCTHVYIIVWPHSLITEQAEDERGSCLCLCSLVLGTVCDL